MEAWLAELALETDPASTFINNLCDEQNETIMGLTFDDQIVATLGHETFSYPPHSAESHNTSFKCAYFDTNNIIGQFTSPTTQFFNNQDNNNNNNNNNNNIINGNDYDNDNNDDDNDDNNNNNNNSMDSSNNVNVLKNQQNNKACKEDNNKKEGGTKRKRHPSQVQDHIIAERRRRELLSQLFISLSAIVPGLKKVDKTSVLGEAIKYMKQLQEKVKVLEEAAIKRTIVVFKNSQLMDDDDNGYSSTIDNGYSTASGGLNRNNNNNNNNDDGDGDGDDNNNIGGGGSNNDANNYNDSLPEIEVKTISGKTILLRVNCEDQKGILAKLFAELDKHDLSVTNCSAVPFDTLGLDITIVAQIMERSFNNNVKDFIRSLRSTLRLRR